MLWTLGFIVTFVIGGMTGVLLALPPADYLMHNTTFLVAHFHNMLIPGALFGYFAGYMYWFPKAFGFTLNERWGVRAFWFWLIGFYLAFMPLYVLGFMGMPRRHRALQHRRLAALPDRGRAGRLDDPGRHRLPGGAVHRQRPASASRRSISAAIHGTAARWNG